MNTLSKRAFKDAVFDQLALVGKALGSGHRLEMLELLAQSERTVEELAKEAGLSVANTSQHLQILRSVKLVAARKEGLYVRYRVPNAEAIRLWLSLRAFGEREIAEVERIVQDYLHDRRNLEPITIQELRSRIDRGDVVVVDVRPETEYSSGHIRGAHSIPLNDLERRLRELPKRKMIVAYCRGPYCIFADEAVRLLTSRGYRARRLSVGFPDWRMLGLPVGAVEGSPA